MIAPDRLPTLPYWPFTPSDAPLPALDAIPIDAPLDPGGCGALTWDRHPVPGATFCRTILCQLQLGRALAAACETASRGEPTGRLPGAG